MTHDVLFLATIKHHRFCFYLMVKTEMQKAILHKHKPAVLISTVA